MSAGNTLLLAALFLAIGAVGGALVAALVSGAKKGEGDAPDLTLVDGAGQSRQPAGLADGSFQEAACLWRDESSGRLVTEIKGAVYPSRQQMNPVAQELSRELAREWLVWLGEEAPPAAAPATPPPAPSLEALKITMPTPASAKKPAPAMEDEQEKKPEVVNESIVVQIDNILQDMLAGSTLESRHIRLAEGANMGVIVWVGSEYFQGIDKVADPVIAQVIRAAVAEWERRSVPNR
jgi:hypothetical protein